MLITWHYTPDVSNLHGHYGSCFVSHIFILKLYLRLTNECLNYDQDYFQFFSNVRNTYVPSDKRSFTASVTLNTENLCLHE